MSSSDDEHEVYGRENYKSRAHKLATLFIMTAGSANARQFPTMFIVNGGVPFLLAYLAFLGVVAFPIMHLESNLAQFAGDGNFGVFSAVPLFIGVGYTMSLYAIVHMVADSVPVSDQLHYLFDSLRQAGGNECRNGLLLASNRTCYVPRHTLSLCRTTRAQLAEAFRRHSLNQGIPVVESGSKGAHVVLVPPEIFRHDMAGCLPGVYNYLQPYQPRRHANWLEESSSALSEIQAQPLLSLAAVWMVVFALAHQRFNRVKWVLYGMVCIHVATTLLLLVRGATLPGAMSGLGTMFYSDWSYAVNLEMWSNALYVSLESVGVTGSIYLGIVRFNNFKNVYQRDVYFVLVADTATEVLRTAIAFMFLGHLASTVGIDVRMLVGIESGVVVGILPQAMSVVPYQELWGQVHALWLLSTMLPKFLIVPDIIIEVLTPAQPFILLNRTLIYFFLCVSILMTSAFVCSPGGANVAAIIAHNHDQNLRFVVLFLESVALLQFYGARRIDIACRMMTGRECSEFVKVCLASIIPVVIIILFLAKIASKLWEGSNFPIWIYAVITWFWLVQLSFIPVFVVVLLNDQNLTFENLLVPLPTWVPLNWEQAMYYRKTLVVEGFDSNAVKNPEARPRVQFCMQLL
ncbi:sodium- and chloride-dependent glycine transporter 2-like [Dermacentor albipictus]|uniref:sodium- and chloride-dependent glycine transporter 2-like n=1 Tax=Dermacentor albipictus TaxID=60249 RepID=UPI0031FDEB5B